MGERIEKREKNRERGVVDRREKRADNHILIILTIINIILMTTAVTVILFQRQQCLC